MMWFYENPTTIVISLIALAVTLVAQFYINSKYKRSKAIEVKTNMTGAEVARKILDSNNLNEIYVVETKGVLTDHYDPKRKVVRLSTDVYNQTSVAAVSIAAHEVGHAIQHKEGYFFMKIRALIFPLVNFGSKAGYFAILLGLFFSSMDLAYVGLFLLGFYLLFQLVTLPVEFNASKEANQQLIRLGIINDEEEKESKTMLKAAALTYVAGLVSTILELLRLLVMVRGRDD